ncbi:aminotransferase class IV family protein [Maritalea porphyrae]|uniref:aminotransferase class IV family protein n=1 Tax=Maritalea porphyrae TaxID=880732 RepID=UPI0022AFEE3D|nr:aminotransferase class IV family protein [Maritalea porphyrae]MCZ4272836.1 aminotransferase class IV family protein [Maritalea porphyrae]
MESALRDHAPKDLRVFETMLWTPDKGVQRLDLHLARLARGCARLGIEAGNIKSILDVIRGDKPQRMRLSVGFDNDVKIETWDFLPLPEDTVWRVSIASEQVRADDPWLKIKTTKRELYNQLRADLPDGLDEYILLNEHGDVCEGTITNVFADMGEGLLTPPLSSGLLPGILRQELLESGNAREMVLQPNDLREARELYVGNSLRGIIRARLV